MDKAIIILGLVLEEGNKPRWTQLYIYGIEHEIENRISASKCTGEKSSVDPNLVVGLQKMLDENNILAKTFRMARDRFKQEDYHEFTLKLIGKRNKSGTHGLPSASKVAALVVRDPNENEGCYIIVEYKDMVPQRISEIHPKLMSLQYPLLFPYGEDGFTLEIPYKYETGVSLKRKYVTMLEYYAYYLHQGQDESLSLLMSGCLSLQFWVDVFTCIEQNRLNWIRHNQGKLRTKLYSGLQDALERGDIRTKQVGKRIYLPSSHTIQETWLKIVKMQWHCFEALDKSLRDILRCTNENSDSRPFGCTKGKKRTHSQCINKALISMGTLPKF
jgi:hypothetical protein